MRAIARGGLSLARGRHAHKRERGARGTHVVRVHNTVSRGQWAPQDEVTGRTISAEKVPEDRVRSVSRREHMGAAATLVAAVLGQDGGARAEGTDNENYCRSIRKRFETSISASTRDYCFSYPADWKEEVVSLNDGKLYGVDTRYGDGKYGQLSVAVLPYGDRESIADAGDPLDVLDNFYELIGAFWYQNGFGEPLDEGTVLSAKSMVRKANRRQQGGQGEATYYMYEMKPHTFISATVSDGQLYVMNASSTARQWSAAAAGGGKSTKEIERILIDIVNSFEVPA